MLASSPDAANNGLPHDAGAHQHLVQFYESEDFLSGVVADFVVPGLTGDDSAILIATGPHRSAFADRLSVRGIDVDAACADGRLVLLDARECLDQFMVDGSPSWEQFCHLIEPVIAAARRPAGRVRAYGEMVDLLWRDGNPLGAIRLEEMWNDLGRRHEFTLLCAYVMGNFYRADHAAHFEQICRSHSQVYPTERFSEAQPPELRSAEIAQLEQRALALESEIAHRRELEQGLRDALAARRRVEEALGASREELADFLESAVEGIHAVGPDGIIIWANRAELEMLGYSREEYVGHPITDFHVDAEVISDILVRLKRNETLRDYESRLRCKDGSIRDVIISSNVALRDGKFLHTRCFTRDMTERRRLEEQLRHKNEDLTKALRFSELFVGVLGHDLRNPLSAVSTTATLLAQKGEPEVTTRARRILNSADRMSRMIDQLLDFTRIRLGGGFALDRRRCDLADISRQVIDELTADERREAVRLETQGDLVGEWDQDRMAQLISNLIGNALVHGESGHPIEVRLDGSDPGGLEVQVSNLGAIAEDVLPVLFEPLKASVKRTGSSGVGLGLFISQQIARAHDGELTVHAEATNTSFHLRLPRAPGPR